MANSKFICCSLSILLLITISCGKRALTPVQYLRYIDDKSNGLIKEKQIGPYTVTCEFKPAGYIVLKEKFKQINDNELKDIGDELSDASEMNHFYMRFTAEGENDILKSHLQSQAEYYERLNYFSNFIQKDLYLISGSDTIDCAYTYFERNFGLSNRNTLLLGFKKGNYNGGVGGGDFTLIYDDQVLGLGPVQFKFGLGDISNIPVLETTKL